MTCPNCGQWMTTTGPAHVCPVTTITIPPVATGGYVPTELDRLRARVAELEDEVSGLTRVNAALTWAKDANMSLADDLAVRSTNAERDRDDALARLAEAEQAAKRYRWLKDRLLGANFSYDAGGDVPDCVIVFAWPKNAMISPLLDLDIDAAMGSPST